MKGKLIVIGLLLILCSVAGLIYSVTQSQVKHFEDQCASLGGHTEIINNHQTCLDSGGRLIRVK